MTTKRITYFLAVLLLFGVASFAYGATDDSRYFIKSTSGFWKKSLGVRHSFDNGFTTDLSDFQLRVAKIFGVSVEPVKKLYVLPDSPASKGKSSKPAPSSQVPWGVKMVSGDPSLSGPAGGSGVMVAVLDTGVALTHPDLKHRIVDCKDFSSAQPIVDGKCDDKNGHGTHVSGIIAADGGDNGLGIFGVAPQSDLLEYKVCGNNGSCWADDIAVAMKTAADNKAEIINLSLGSDAASPLIEDAVAYAVQNGVLVVAAAGNDGPYQGSIDYPAAEPDVVAVGALDINKSIPDWSSRGVNSTDKPYVKENKDIELAAPGVNIESTSKDGGYIILSGTSMAAPHVSGLAAKLWQKDADNPAKATRDMLHSLSKDIDGPGDDDSSGWGLPSL